MAQDNPGKRRDSRMGKGFKEGRNIASIVLWGVLILVGLLSIRSHLSIGSTQVGYSDFKTLVVEGKVKRVRVKDDELIADLKDNVEVKALAGKGRAGKPPRTLKVVRIKEGGENIVAFLEQNRVPFEGQKDTDSWLPLVLWFVMPLVVLVFVWRLMFKRIGGGASGALSFGKSKAKIRGEQDVQVTFSDVAGVEEAKEELKEIIEFLQHPEKFTRIGAKIPKGVLLVGPPGTGKTLLARAVAGEAKVPFFSISGSEFVEMFVGVGAARVRDLFEQASRQAPCIVFIDELDALGKTRGVGVLSGNDEREQTLNQLLVEMDGFDANKGVIIMAATNRPEILDFALLRPGRFDRRILVDRPDRKGREEILKVHTRGVKTDPGVDLGAVAAQTPGFAGADLANLANEAALLAARRGKGAVEQADLVEAIERGVAGLERKSRVITEKEKEIVAHHEVGHALVAEFLDGGEKVAKISIVPRGLAALGYTMQMPVEDRSLMRRSELMAKIAGLLGGRAAEMIVFGEVSTGAQNDLQRATDIARAMVVDFGMSGDIGPLSLGARRRGGGLADEMSLLYPTEKMSEDLARRVDVEVSAIVDEAWRGARALLEGKEKLLRRIAAALIEREYLEESEFKTLIREFPSS